MYITKFLGTTFGLFLIHIQFYIDYSKQTKFMCRNDYIEGENFSNARLRENPDWKVISECMNSCIGYKNQR